MPAALRSRPDGRQVVLLHAQQVDALAAGDLDGRDVELVGHVGDGAQLRRRGHAAPHARHHRIGAVLLDVGVDALVDEARAGSRRGTRPARRRAGSSSAPAGTWRSRPACVQSSACITAGMVFSSCARIAWRTSSWPWSVQSQTGLTFGRLHSRRPASAPAGSRPGRCRSRRRPRPWCGRAPASSVVRPLARDGQTMVPLQTPLQPQISASSAMAATAGARVQAGAGPRRRPGRRSACRASRRRLGPARIRSKIPVAVGGVAVQHRADQLAVSQHQRL